MNSKLELVKPQFHLRGNKIHFISLGCPRNLVDTEVMLGVLLQAGYEAVPDLIDADYIVINTCGFLKASRDESLETIGTSLKNRKKGAKVIAAGCMVQTHSDEIKAAFPDVHYLLGSGEVAGILQAVSAEECGEAITSARSYLEIGEVPRKLSTPKSFAYLKIAEGCRKRCAYCIIPTIKGPLQSKPIERVQKEFSALLDQGVKEIVLIAQDLGDWGKDFGYKKSEGLLLLLKKLLEDKRDFWLRLLYLYPDEITDDLIKLIASDSRICRYIDMPIQHVNNDLLKAMRRQTSKEDIIQTISQIRKTIPDFSIRTSLIVGFPGETEEQFEELVQFIQDYPLDQVGIFAYSKEEGSASFSMEGHLPEEVKIKRQKKLAETQMRVLKKSMKKFLGKKLKVLIEGFHPETELLLVGRHEGQCPDIDGTVLINDFRKVKELHTWYTVEITEVNGYDLVGRVIGPLQDKQNSSPQKKSNSLQVVPSL